MKVILLPVADRPECADAADVAFTLARQLDGDVVGCHLRPHRDKSRGYKATTLGLFASADSVAMEALSRKHSVSATKAAQRLFAAKVLEHDFRSAKTPRLTANHLAIWQELVGSPDKLMAIAGPVADLTVVSRPRNKGDALARTFVLEALMRTGRPVLVLPQKYSQSVGKRIVIAWNQSPDVSRTVASCMPLLQQAEAVTVVRCGPEDGRGPTSSALVNYLKHNGISAERERTPGRNETQELLQSAKTAHADLVLMGAYSRSRLREVVLGGMTEHMLWQPRLPVIMQHT